MPRTVEATWAWFDPRGEPLDTEIIREWTEDGIALRHIRGPLLLLGATNDFNSPMEKVALPENLWVN